MHMLSLAIRDLWTFMRTKKLLFIMLLLGFMAALYSTFYFITIALDEVTVAKQITNYDRKITINHINNLSDNKAVDALYTMLQEWGWDDFTAFYQIPSDRAVDGDIIAAGCNVIPPGFEENCDLKEGKFLSVEDIHSNSPVCVVTQSLVDYLEKPSWLGQTFPIGDMELKIKGVHSDEIYWIPEVYEKLDMDQLVAPAGLLGQAGLPIVHLYIIGNSIPTSDQLQSIQDWINLYTPEAEVEWPISTTASNSWRTFLINLAFQIIIMGLALINMVAILVSWIYSNRRQWYAFYVCGAGKRRLLALVSLEMAILSLLAALFGCIGYMASDTILSWGGTNYRLNLSEGLMIYLALMTVTTGIVLVRSTPIIWNIVQERGR